jgi:hypothetical protein
VTVTSSRSFRVAGFVQTSHGRVATTVEQNIQFSNSQNFDITNTQFIQNITQDTSISSVTKTQGDGESVSVDNFDWPLQLDFAFVINPDGSAFQKTTIQQAYKNKEAVTANGGPASFSSVSNSVSPSDTLLFDSSFNITGSQGQANTQEYVSRDSSGRCFSRTITAANGVLTSITDGIGCKGKNNQQ